MNDLQLPINPETGERAPFHPSVPGLQALSLTKRGKPIWPVRGGSGEGEGGSEGSGDGSGTAGAGDGGDSGQGGQSGGDGGAGNGGSDNDRGFPANTAVKDMTAEQQAAYWRHHDRRKSDTLKAYGGITPEEARRLKDESDQRRREGLQPDERALEDARTEAAAKAMQEAASQWAPILAEEIVSRFITDEQHREAVMAGIDPMRFVTDGTFDKDALIAHLTGLSAAFGGNGTGDHQPRQWGQSGGRPPAPRQSDEGLAEAKRRGYIEE